MSLLLFFPLQCLCRHILCQMLGPQSITHRENVFLNCLSNESSEDPCLKVTCFRKSWVPWSKDLVLLCETLAWWLFWRGWGGCGGKWVAGLCWRDEDGADWGQEHPGRFTHALFQYAYLEHRHLTGASHLFGYFFLGKKLNLFSFSFLVRLTSMVVMEGRGRLWALVLMLWDSIIAVLKPWSQVCISSC